MVPIIFLFLSSEKISYNQFKLLTAYLFVAFLTLFIYYFGLFLDKGGSFFSLILTKESEAKFLGLFSCVSAHAFDWLLNVFNACGVILVLAGFGFMFLKKQFKEAAFLILWFIVFQLFYGNISSTGIRYLVIGWIPLIIAEGYFLGRTRGLNYYLALLILFLVCVFNIVGPMKTLIFRHRHALQVDFANWVKEKTPDDAAILAMDEAIFIRYYAKREILSRPITCKTKEMKDFFEQVVDKYLEEGRKVYFIGTTLAYDRCDVFSKMVFEFYTVIEMGKHKNEDWHHALLGQSIFDESLYRLKKKSREGIQ